MKVQNPYLFDAFSYILVTDVVTELSQPWTGIFQVQSAPIPFYDYMNYSVTASGTNTDTFTATLNGNNVTLSSVTYHVPNFQTGGVQNGVFNSLVQYWAMVDSLDVELQVTLHGTQLFQLTKDQTYLTPATSGVSQYISTPQYAYGTQIIPTFIVTNTNPYNTIANSNANQGIQVWGNRYKVAQLTDLGQAQAIFNAGRYTPITVTPPNF